MTRSLLLLAGIAALACAQTEAPGARTIGRPRGPAIGAGEKYLYAYATPDPQGPTIHCEGPGIDCVAVARLLQPARATHAHDATLQEATVRINQILVQAERAAPRGKALCLYRSARGPVLVWRAAEPRAATTSARPAEAVTDPEAIADLLGIEPARGRMVAGGAGGTLEAELVWNDLMKHYQWKCTKAGNNCVIHTSFASVRSAGVFDSTLAQATEQINSILERTAARPPQPGMRLCLMFLPAGPVLAWTSSESPAQSTGRQRTVTAADPDFDRLSRETLGLE
jgi:hypothetical protein